MAAERDDLRASLKAAEEALAQTLADRQSGIERENADLRRRIVEVADALASPGQTSRVAHPAQQPERV
ncbi:hypothetical protein ACRAWG_06020 [Methylobacterium sp. P31]